MGLFSSFEAHEVIFPQIMHIIINQKGKPGGTLFVAFTAFTDFTASTAFLAFIAFTAFTALTVAF